MGTSRGKVSTSFGFYHTLDDKNLGQVIDRADETGTICESMPIPESV